MTTKRPRKAERRSRSTTPRCAADHSSSGGGARVRGCAGARADTGEHADESRAGTSEAVAEACAPRIGRARLGERFYAVLCRQPGETMTALAPQVGVAPRVLQVAVARLRRTGRVRAIGKRQGRATTRWQHRRQLRQRRRRDCLCSGEQRWRGGAVEVRLATGGEEPECVLALLARGVGDGHEALGEQIAALALRTEAAPAPQHERPELPLSVVMPRPGLCRAAGPRAFQAPGGSQPGTAWA